MANTRILDLTTDNPRPVVAIDRVEYQIRTGADLTLEQYRYLEHVTPRVGELLTLPALSPADGAELETHLERLVPIALDAPADVLAKLKPLQRLMIWRSFMTLSSPAMEAAARALETAGRSNGARPSRGSSGSTQAGRRDRGSRKRR